MPEPLALFVVETSFQIPGLGILALPVVPAPAWLAECALHTTWAITVLIEGQMPHSTFGTVEELVHDEQLSHRTLLLDFDLGVPLPKGCHLQTHETLTQLS